MVIANVTARPHGSRADIRPADRSSCFLRPLGRFHPLFDRQGFTRFIELGPGTVLSGFVKRIDKNVQIHKRGRCSQS